MMRPSKYSLTQAREWHSARRTERQFADIV
jgi:hypothetical protein